MPLRLSFETGALAGIHIVTSAPTIRLGRDPAAQRHPAHQPEGVAPARVHRALGARRLLDRDPRHRPVASSTAMRSRRSPGARRCSRCRAAITSTSAASSSPVSEADGQADRGVRSVGRPRAPARRHACGSAAAATAISCSTDRGVADEHLVITLDPARLPRRRARADDVQRRAGGEPRARARRRDRHRRDHAALHRHRRARARPRTSPTPVGVDATLIAGDVDRTRSASSCSSPAPARASKIPLGDKQIILGTARRLHRTMLGDLLASPLHCAISKRRRPASSRPTSARETGTFVNGERITKGTALKPGDLIAIGSHVARGAPDRRRHDRDQGHDDLHDARASASAGPQPRFVIDGRVVAGAQDRDRPRADLRRHRRRRRHVARALRDRVGRAASSSATRSSHGTYVDDKRVVQQQLPPSCVLRIGDTLFRVAVRGEVCTIERADAALAAGRASRSRATRRRSSPRRRACRRRHAVGAAGAGGSRRADADDLPHGRRRSSSRRSRRARRTCGAAHRRGARRAISRATGRCAARSCSRCSRRSRCAAARCSSAAARRSSTIRCRRRTPSAAFAAKARGATRVRARATPPARGSTPTRCTGCHTGFTAAPQAPRRRLRRLPPRARRRADPKPRARTRSATLRGCHPHQHAADFEPAGPRSRSSSPPAPLPGQAKLDDRRAPRRALARARIGGPRRSASAAPSCHAHARRRTARSSRPSPASPASAATTAAPGRDDRPAARAATAREHTDR